MKKLPFLIGVLVVLAIGLIAFIFFLMNSHAPTEKKLPTFYNYTEISLLKGKYLVGEFRQEGKMLTNQIYSPNYDNPEWNDQHPLEVFKILFMIQSNSMKNQTVYSGQTLKEYAINETSDWQEDSELSYPYCIFKKQVTSGWGTRINAICEDSFNLILISSQSRDEARARALMKEVLDVMIKR